MTPLLSRATRAAPFAAIAAPLICAALACSPKDRSGLPEGVAGNSPSFPVLPAASASAEAGADGSVLPQPTDAGDAGSPEAAPIDAGPCLAGATWSMDGAFGGALALRGTVTVPAPLPVGRTVVLTVAQIVGTVSDAHTQSFTTTSASDRSTYRIGGLARGAYRIRVQADANGNGAVNDPGDYDGYYDGTAAGPILNAVDAKTVTLATDCVDKLDFGAGVKP